MWQTAKKAMFSESCSDISVALRRGFRAETQESIKIRRNLLSLNHSKARPRVEVGGTASSDGG
jgi:hypothetical protein